MTSEINTSHLTTKPSILIDLKGLKVSYNQQLVLDIPDASIKGNTIALIGHNGAGKSTLLKTLLNLHLPSNGEFSLLHYDQSGSLDRLIPEKDLAFCPDSGSVFTDISVRKYIELWGRLKCGDAKFYKTDHAAKILDLLDLEPLLNKLGRELSKGQKRKVQTAIGLLIQPKLFLIDEPFDGLDVQSTHKLTSLIRDISSNMTFIISSHRMDVMERISDQVMVLHKGKLVSNGTVHKVASQLADLTYVLETTDNHQALAAKITLSFPTAVVNLIGGYITVTGKNLSLESLALAVSEPKISIRAINPTLVDAMTYHLKNDS